MENFLFLYADFVQILLTKIYGGGGKIGWRNTRTGVLRKKEKEL